MGYSWVIYWDFIVIQWDLNGRYPVIFHIAIEIQHFS